MFIYLFNLEIGYLHIEIENMKGMTAYSLNADRMLSQQNNQKKIPNYFLDFLHFKITEIPLRYFSTITKVRNYITGGQNSYRINAHWSEKSSPKI